MRKLTYVLLTALIAITLLPSNTQADAVSDLVDSSDFIDITQNSASLQIIMDDLDHRSTLYYLVVEKDSAVDEDLQDDLSAGNDSTFADKVKDPLEEYSDDRNLILENGKRNPINTDQEVLLNLDVQPDGNFRFYAVLEEQVEDGNIDILFEGEEFSTHRFPNVKDDIGSEDSGFYVEGAPSDIPSDWSFIRGVDSSVGGEVVLTFENDISFYKMTLK